LFRRVFDEYYSPSEEVERHPEAVYLDTDDDEDCNPSAQPGRPTSSDKLHDWLLWKLWKLHAPQLQLLWLFSGAGGPMA
jgi:hypothetical protein